MYLFRSYSLFVHLLRLVSISFASPASALFVHLDSLDRNHAARKETRTTPGIHRRHATSSRLYMYKPLLPNFCADCGAAEMELKIPPGDERLRATCALCGYIVYQNPKVVVSCVVTTDDDRILLAKRAIEPRKGTWGIPQGYMEHGETSRQAAAREVLEETGAIVNHDELKFRAVYNVPGSVQLVYQTQVSSSHIEKQIAQYNPEIGESEKVELVTNESLAHKELCFPTVQWALAHCLSQKDRDHSVIQQMTKYYDAQEETWSEIEDEPL